MWLFCDNVTMSPQIPGLQFPLLHSKAKREPLCLVIECEKKKWKRFFSSLISEQRSLISDYATMLAVVMMGTNLVSL